MDPSSKIIIFGNWDRNMQNIDSKNYFFAWVHLPSSLLEQFRLVCHRQKALNMSVEVGPGAFSAVLRLSIKLIN